VVKGISGGREPIVMRFRRSSLAYEQKLLVWPLGPLLWARPKTALRALREAMPWEALGVSAMAALVLYARLGADLGISLGIGVALALVALQMMRGQLYATPTRLVQERGLFFLRRRVTEFKAVRETRAEGGGDLGDIVLVGAFGEVRIPAVRHPGQKLDQLRELITEARGAA
jgi:hypothetical protein